MAETAGLTIIEPESDRYRAELVFVHGLWVGAEVWRAVAAGFAHRGWRCLLLDRVAAERDADPSRSWPEHLAAVLAERDAPPIVVGHDAGALLALDVAARGTVRAAVAVAPLLDGTRAVLPTLARMALRVRSSTALVAPPTATDPYFARIPQPNLDAIAGGLAAERVGFVRALDALASPAQPRVPALVVAHDADPVSPRVLAEISARGIEADFLRLPGGHWPMLEPRADDWITQVHRWIIKRVGHGLLMLRGDEDLTGE